MRDCTVEAFNPIYIVKYEDLYSDPAEQFEVIMNFLPDLDCLDLPTPLAESNDLSLKVKIDFHLPIEEKPWFFNQNDS